MDDSESDHNACSDGYSSSVQLILKVILIYNSQFNTTLESHSSISILSPCTQGFCPLMHHLLHAFFFSFFSFTVVLSCWDNRFPPHTNRSMSEAVTSHGKGVSLFIWPWSKISLYYRCGPKVPIGAHKCRGIGWRHVKIVSIGVTECALVDLEDRGKG